jgi:hypothetical protein
MCMLPLRQLASGGENALHASMSGNPASFGWYLQVAGSPQCMLVHQHVSNMLGGSTPLAHLGAGQVPNQAGVVVFSHRLFSNKLVLLLVSDWWIGPTSHTECYSRDVYVSDYHQVVTSTCPTLQHSRKMHLPCPAQRHMMQNYTCCRGASLHA